MALDESSKLFSTVPDSPNLLCEIRNLLAVSGKLKTFPQGPHSLLRKRFSFIHSLGLMEALNSTLQVTLTLYHSPAL